VRPVSVSAIAAAFSQVSTPDFESQRSASNCLEAVNPTLEPWDLRRAGCVQRAIQPGARLNLPSVTEKQAARRCRIACVATSSAMPSTAMSTMTHSRRRGAD
jgi:hypothetical protein